MLLQLIASLVSAAGTSTASPAGRGFELEVGGLVQVDGRFFARDEAEAAIDQLVVRRARISIEGTLFGFAEVKIMPELAAGQLGLLDAFVDLAARPWLRARVGKQKAPFGLERLQNPAHSMFVELAYPTQLAPNRDVGLMIHGQVGQKTVRYAVGVFDGAADGGSSDSDASDSKDLVARLMLQPFASTEIEWLREFGLGVAVSYGDQAAGSGLGSYKSAGQSTFLSFARAAPQDSARPSGGRVRLSPQAYVYAGPVSLLSEFVYVDQRVSRGSVASHLYHRAWQAAFSIVLTGERASYRGVQPENPVGGRSGGLGAIEAAARWSSIELDVDAVRLGLARPESSTSSQALAIGLNWYLNDYVKAVIDFERSSFEGGQRPTELLVAGRVQLAL